MCFSCASGMLKPIWLVLLSESGLTTGYGVVLRNRTDMYVPQQSHGTRKHSSQRLHQSGYGAVLRSLSIILLDKSTAIFENNSMTRNRYKVYEKEYPYLVTCTIVNWLDLLKPEKAKIILIDSLRFLRKEKAIKIFAYVIMHNHLHLIVSSDDLSKNICRFKSYTAKQIINHYKNTGKDNIIKTLSTANPEYRSDCEHQFWQEGFCPKQIMSLDIFQQKIDYIHLNPVRMGYVDSPEKWK